MLTMTIHLMSAYVSSIDMRHEMAQKYVYLKLHRLDYFCLKGTSFEENKGKKSQRNQMQVFGFFDIPRLVRGL